MMDQKESEKIKTGWLSIIGGVAMHLMLGNLYLWGNISGYVVAYFHYLGDQNATVSNAIIVIPLSKFIQSVLNPVGAFL